jgi:hypothetical protein
MSQNKELSRYIYQQIQAGLSPNEITTHLKNAGWPEDIINNSFKEVSQSIQPNYSGVNPPEHTVEQSANIVKSNIGHEDDHNNLQAPADTQLVATGNQRGKFKTSWLLLKQTATVFKHNKELVKYPLISFIVSILLLIAAAIVFFNFQDVLLAKDTDFYGDEEYYLTNIGLMAAFIYYVLAYSLLFYFTAAMTANILDIFKGQSKSLSVYFKLAQTKLPAIILFAVITTTVGFILRLIEQRFRFIGFLVSRFLGLVWSLANLFTIPVIVESNDSAPKAIKESSQLFISRWGENILSRAGFGIAAFLIYLGIFVVLTFFVIILSALLGGIGFIVSIFILISAIIIIALIENTLSTILNTALYYYTKYNLIPAAFTQEMLNSALIPKKPKK